MKLNKVKKERLVIETANKISSILERVQGKDVLLMLAGGSAFAVYDSIHPDLLNEKITLAMTDDRFSNEMDTSNSHQLQATDFYNSCIEAGVYYISSEIWHEENPEELAKRFEFGLKKWRKEFPKGVVVAVFGIGEDGHTAGMIPGGGISGKKKYESKDLFDKLEDWVVGYRTENNEHKDRVTITMPFIRNEVEHAIVFVSGEKKRPALQKLLAEAGSLEATPARIIRELKDVEIFTDII